MDGRNGLSDAGDERDDPVGELLARLSACPDRATFAELFKLAAPRIKALGMRGGASEPLAEELAQETMIAVWRFVARYDPSRASGMAWIYAIARNKRIDMFRKERRPEIDPEDPSIRGREPEDAEQILTRTSDESALHRHLEDLPAEQSRAVRMAFIEEKSHGEIARELDLALGTVKSRIRLGLARLKSTLAEIET